MKTKIFGQGSGWLVMGILILAQVPMAAAEVELHGFIEGATGIRATGMEAYPIEWMNDPGIAQKLPRVYREDRSDYTLRETRLQLKGDMYGDVGEGHFVVDFLSDDLAGDGVEMAIREGYLKFNTFADHLEVRAGRQPTTWGTGDLLFINDLFPKDYVSFFSGREDQYLKSPSDVIRLGVFGLPVGVDLVYTPQFTPNNLPTGDRFSFWNPAYVGVDPVKDKVENGELAVRLHRYVGGFNLAAYGYVGFWKNPYGMLVDDMGSPTAYYYPELRVYGASARGGLFGGVAWLEGGYYDSPEDSDGSDPLVPNSQIKAMAGYERSWWTDFTGNLQLYWEGMVDYDKARAALDMIHGKDVAYLQDENRFLITSRWMQLLFYQNLNLTAFGFYSPTDEDGYIRLSAAYNYSDNITLTVGGNVFHGADRQTLFGMNESNDNMFVRMRYSF